ncbi:MAG TPA: hypothetical protein VF066_10945 [Thermoleophilaceae bacterium]
MPDDLAAIDDRPHHQQVVGEELAPMRLVRRPVTRGERRHRIGDRIGLLAVEDLEVVGLDGAKHDGEHHITSVQHMPISVPACRAERQRWTTSEFKAKGAARRVGAVYRRRSTRVHRIQ